MTTAEGLVTTGRADRYLDQFAKHLAHQPGGIQARSDPDGSLLVDFGGATCRLRATADSLILYAEAAAPEELGGLQRRLTERLEQLGRRDGLAVRWSPDFIAAAPSEAGDHRGHGHHR
ncbi:hypothetical protein EV138_3565 [Kribbella voronezhensis]|uniref:DUF2218 domain-containing protein n=1 Tax=Kribbella voronezhensis TaxID=2512212 RepID=A0A4R7TD16_9ACTN|nr:DUF2218 domain-containing protein [Kribbella voronezhensis]TDU89984.1 hypothetical protein EV138_3565 [Kribbella voronezhensis]